MTSCSVSERWIWTGMSRSAASFAIHRKLSSVTV